MDILIVNNTEVPFPKNYILRWVPFVFRKLKKKRVDYEEKQSLTLVFLEPSESKKINFQYRKKNKATDVLSFSGLDPESYGELLICPEVLKRQAKEHGLSFRDELAYVVLHGILHLLGFEHECGGEKEKEMFDLQDKIFEEISFLKGSRT